MHFRGNATFLFVSPKRGNRLSPYNCVKRNKKDHKKRVILIPYDTMFLTTKTIKEELIMTQLQFNLDFDEIKEKVINSSLDDILKSTIVIVLNEFMKQERDEYLNVRAYERSDERRDYRNGYYPREMMMNIGKVNLRVPRTRSGEFDTTVFEKYQRSDQGLLIAMVDMVGNGG